MRQLYSHHKTPGHNDGVALRQLYSHHKTPGHNDGVALRQLYNHHKTPGHNDGVALRQVLNKEKTGLVAVEAPLTQIPSVDRHCTHKTGTSHTIPKFRPHPNQS